MKNNKGMTLVEIIISISLISIVLLFMFSLFINVQDINNEADTNTTYLISKSLEIKAIESDLNNYNNIEVEGCSNLNTTNCSIDEIFKNTNRYNPWLIIKFIFDEEDIGYFGIYYLNTRNDYVMSYIHVNEDENINIRETRVLEDFKKNNIKSNKIECKYRETDHPDGINKAFLLTIPMLGPDYKDYSLNISYYGSIDLFLNNICS